MWLVLAFSSALVLGLYDVAKKQALRHNAVLLVLFFTTLLASLLFAPFIIISYLVPEVLEGSIWYVPRVALEVHGLIFVKSVIVLLAWLLGYMGLKHLPITLVGPINATRPVMVLVGAMLIFGERLNLYQWIGVGLAIASLFLLSRSGKKEGIDFVHDRWVLCIFGSAVLGAASGLYDKYLLTQLEPMLVQAWYNLYQVLIMCPVLYILWQRKPGHEPMRWTWALVLVPTLLSIADFAYFMALTDSEAMISVVSMIRRGSVLVSFACGAILFGERNLRGKALDLLLILIGMVFLYLGSHAHPI